jgi:branched-chain amino acid aminotransferase
MIKDDVVVTPPVSVGVLNGITRGAVLEVAAKAGLKTCERMVTRFELYVADEMFLTGTAAELIPVVMIDGRLIGTGNVGKHTSALISAFKKITKKDGVRYAL